MELNTLPERELADLIYRYGEERLSRRVARAIVERGRDQAPDFITVDSADGGSGAAPLPLTRSTS